MDKYRKNRPSVSQKDKLFRIKQESMRQKLYLAPGPTTAGDRGHVLGSVGDVLDGQPIWSNKIHYQTDQRLESLLDRCEYRTIRFKCFFRLRTYSIEASLK